MDDQYFVPSSAVSGSLTPKTPNFDQQSPNSIYLNSPEDTIARLKAGLLTLPKNASRGRHALSRLAFWKKQPPTASTVEHAIDVVSKSHKRYLKDLEAALDTLEEWAVNPPNIPQDILNLQEYEGRNQGYARVQVLVDAMKPVVDAERLMTEATSAFSHGFHAISEQEHNLQESQNRFNFALYRFCKSLPKGTPREVMSQIHDEINRQGNSITTDVDNLYKAVNLQLLLPFRQLTTYLVDSAARRNLCQNLIHNNLDYSNDEREIGLMHSQLHSSPSPADMRRGSPNSGLHTGRSQINKIRAKDIDNLLGRDLFSKSDYGLSNPVAPLRVSNHRQSRSSSTNSLSSPSTMNRHNHGIDTSQDMLPASALPGDAGGVWS